MNKRGIPEKRVAFLETCFNVFCENGLENTSLKMLADACGVTNGNLLYYFGDKDGIIIEATAHCMAKVEDDFMAHAPRDFEDVERFLREMPYLTAKLHGANTVLCIRCTQARNTASRASSFSKASISVIGNMPNNFPPRWDCPRTSFKV